MSRLVMVPVHLDAIHVAQAYAPHRPTGAFTRLPHAGNDGHGWRNLDRPYRMSTVHRPPFADTGAEPADGITEVGPGVHLHWAMPDALTRSFRDGELPTLPNRWVVVRRAGGEQTTWIVESDFLRYDDAPPAWPAVSVLIRNSDTDLPQSVWLGHTRPLGDDQPASHGRAALTTMLTGDPLFTALYPACRGVFGFHDDGVGVDGAPLPADLEYTVFGWYASTPDALAQTVAELDRERVDGDPAATVDDALAWLGWSTASPVGDARAVCYARLAFADGEALQETPGWDPSDLEVALGNTAGDGLAALLSGGSPSVEQALASMRFLAENADTPPDLGHALADFRHGEAFVAVPGGARWVLRPAPPAAPESDDPPPPWVDEGPLVAALRDLVDAQAAYDAAEQRIAGLRERLYADWWHYTEAIYAPVGADLVDRVDPARARAAIADGPLRELEVLATRTGRLQWAAAGPGDDGVAGGEDGHAEPRVDAEHEAALLEVGASDVPVSALARAVVAAHAAVVAAIPIVEGRPAYALVLAPGPRFWEAADPVLVLRGSGVQPTLRHASDGRLEPDGTLRCAPFVPDTTPESDLAAWVDEVHAWTAAAFAAWSASEPPSIAFSRVRHRPWHPVALEWDVAYHAFEDGRRGTQAAYPPDHLEQYVEPHHDLPELWLTPVKQASPTYDAAGGFSVLGRGALTRGAAPTLASRIERYLDGLHAAHTADEHSVGADGWSASFVAHRAAIEDLVAAEPETRRSLITGLLAARDGLRDDPRGVLALPLTGFHAALRMRRLGQELGVFDPTAVPGFGGDRFAQRMALWIGDAIESSPDPDLGFHPLRTGAVRLRRLQLVGSFGEGRVLRQDDGDFAVRRSTTLPGAGDGTHAVLPPRILQRTRLRLRWLDASEDGVEATDHADTGPVHGWVVASQLDQRLVLFDADGRAMGSIEHDATWSPFLAGPSPDPHVQQLVDTLIGGADPSLVLAFLANVADAQELIDPVAAETGAPLAMLVSRPLAVCSVRLQLELGGAAPQHQGHQAFRDAVTSGRERAVGQVDAVRVPVRVGARPPDARTGRPARLDDGVVAVLRSDGWEPQLVMPKSGRSHPRIRVHTTGDLPPTVPVSVAGGPVDVTVLMDPLGKLHAAAGIVPTKALALDPAHYAEALRRIDVAFRSGPLLFRPGRVDLDPPTDRDLSWSWTPQEADGAPPLPLSPLSQQPPLPSAVELVEGFLHIARTTDP